MADNDTQDGFVPEPVPDSIADTDLTGLSPEEPSTEEPQVEAEQDDTEQAQPEEAELTDDAEESEPLEETEEEAEQPAQQPETQTPDPKEVARQQYESRKANKAQRDYVSEQRTNIRQYENELSEKIRHNEIDDIEAIKEQQRVIQANQYVDTVERNRMAVIQDANRAQNDIPFFKSGTPQAQAAFNAAITNFEAAYGITDPDTGEFIGAQDRSGNDVRLFDYLQQQAGLYEQLAGETKRQAQQAEVKMRSKAVNPSNTGKTTSSGDELEDLLDRVGDIDLTSLR